MLRTSLEYTSGEVAHMLGVTRDWLIKGEKIGTFPVAQRDELGRRMYSEADVEMFRQRGVGKGPKRARRRLGGVRG